MNDDRVFLIVIPVFITLICSVNLFFFIRNNFRKKYSLFIREYYGYEITNLSLYSNVEARIRIFLPWKFGLYKYIDFEFMRAERKSTTAEEFITKCHKHVEIYMEVKVKNWEYNKTVRFLANNKEAFSELLQKMTK